MRGTKVPDTFSLHPYFKPVPFHAIFVFIVDRAHMAQTVKTKDTPVPARRSSSAEKQKTVLSDETPAVSITVRASGGRGSSTGCSASPSLLLSSSSLAALSQRY